MRTLTISDTPRAALMTFSRSDKSRKVSLGLAGPQWTSSVSPRHPAWSEQKMPHMKSLSIIDSVESFVGTFSRNFGIVGTRYVNIDQDLPNGRPNTPVTRQLKYTVPEIFYLLEISAPQFQASTQALDAGLRKLNRGSVPMTSLRGPLEWRHSLELTVYCDIRIFHLCTCYHQIILAFVFFYCRNIIACA